jgi:hypothetical protein
MEGKAPAVEDYGLNRMMASCNKDCRPVRGYPVALGQMPASNDVSCLEIKVGHLRIGIMEINISFKRSNK